MTGAPLPLGADAVVVRELAKEARGEVTLPSATHGSHIRRAGEDIAAGSEALFAGSILGPGELAVAAALGAAEIEVARAPQIAILSTGNELVALGKPPGPGQIISSNEYALAAQARDAGAEVVSMGHVGDDRAEVAARIAAALRADILVTSGGVSAGDFDCVRDAFGDAGVELEFWKVAMKPGKPLAFGRHPGGALVFGLPGNPVSSFVTFELFVRPLIKKMLGAAEPWRARVPVEMISAYRKSAGRSHFVRARLTRDGERLLASPHPRQGSGMLSGLVGIDALVEVEAEHESVTAGETLSALLLRAR